MAIDVASETFRQDELVFGDSFDMVGNVNDYYGYKTDTPNKVQEIVADALQMDPKHYALLRVTEPAKEENHVVGQLNPIVEDKDIEVTDPQSAAVELIAEPEEFLEPVLITDRVKLIEADQPEVINELSVEPARQAMSGLRGAIKNRWSKTRHFLKSPEHKTARRRIIGVALGTVALAAAYAESRGIVSVSAMADHFKTLYDHSPKEVNTSHLHEPLQQISPPKTHISLADVAQNHPKSATHLDKVNHVVEMTSNKLASAKSKVDEITVKPGNGISQTIQDYFPGKTPQQYSDALSAASAKFGAENIIQGIPTYHMGDGSLGLSHAGDAHWGAHVHGFLQNYFKHTK